MTNIFLKVGLYIIGILASLGLFAFGAGYLWSQAKKGSRVEKSEVISSAEGSKVFWKEQSEDYKEMMRVKDEKNDATVKELTIQINALTREVGELRGQLNAEKTQNEKLEKIFQGRSPEMEEFMKFMIQATKDQAESHKKIVEVLEKVHTFAEMEHDRDFKITATVSKDGQ